MSSVTILFYLYYSVQSQHTVGHLSPLLHQSWSRISVLSLLNLTQLSIIGPLYYCVSMSRIVDKMRKPREWWQEAQTHIICDFLSQVSLRDEDLGDFFTGSIKHTSHQRVFTVPQSGPLYKVIDKGNSSPQTHSQITQKHNISSDKTTMKATTYRQTRAPYKEQTPQIYSPP